MLLKLSRHHTASWALAALSTAAVAAQAHTRPAPVPPAWLRAPEARLPIQLQHVQVRTEVLGTTAQTQMELSFHNPNERVLEGELQFPLREGQSITGFSLDIGGEWRAAVPVPKAKGQQVFEDVIRARVDPALLERTAGNNYKLRVYPLPAHGNRRVRLDISESLSTTRGQAHYELPLQFGGPVARMDVQVRVVGLGPLSKQVQAQVGSRTVPTTADQDDAVISVQGEQVSHGGTLSIRAPRLSDTPSVSTQTRDGQTYFYAELPVPVSSQVRPVPRHIGLVWDASGSSAERDRSKEWALLDAYLGSFDDVTVHLQVARDQAEPVQRFHIQRGRWSALRQHLEALPRDGATRLASLLVPPDVDLALMFSDGLGNWGHGGLPTSTVPLYSVQATPRADTARLRDAAQRSGGMLLDLSALSTTEAVQALRTLRSRVSAVHSNQAQDLVLESIWPEAEHVTVAGRLTGPQATVVIELLTPQGQTVAREVQVKPHPSRVGTLAGLRWAQMRMAQWEADRPRHRAALQRLATEWGLTSSETSLLVLDNVADYARYDIEPPASLRAAYAELQAQKQAQTQGRRTAHLESVVTRFGAEVSWWGRVFPKTSPRRAQETRDRQPIHALRPPSSVVAQEAEFLAPVATASARAPAAAAPLAKGAQPTQGPVAASIQLQKWVPDAAYARRLRAARTEDLYAIYLDEKPAYPKSTAFFLDVADLMFERGQTELGLRVLSNLAEMDLQNRHILRILGYRLLQAKQVELAIPVFEAVRDLSPDEPQSWRDLGLAHAQAQRAQEAVDALWEVVSRPWDARFPDIELIALNELNAIASRAKVAGQTVDTRAIDPRLLRNLPLDLRAVLSWDADNTDIDLWVIDPNGEATSFSNPLSSQGGRLSRDFTRGYGPEVFSLRDAKPGVYTVKAQFYGHTQQVVAPATTLMLTLSTGFGTEHQSDQAVTLRLNGRGDQVTVGQFEVKPRQR